MSLRKAAELLGSSLNAEFFWTINFELEKCSFVEKYDCLTSGCAGVPQRMNVEYYTLLTMKVWVGRIGLAGVVSTLV